MRNARAEVRVVLDATDAIALWKNVSRWPSFVEGFDHAEQVPEDWPAEGAKLVWQSKPEGRGRVTEKVLQSSVTRFRTRVAEDAMFGEQTITAADEPEGARVTLELSYELTQKGPLGAANDVLFVRRALRDALGRTLRRFAVEAEEEAGLR